MGTVGPGAARGCGDTAFRRHYKSQSWLHFYHALTKCSSTFSRGLLVSRLWQMSNEEFPKKQIETLWAPWRVEYFTKEPRDMEFLSAAARASNDAEHLVITRCKTAFLMMNRYPYSVGHLMAVPYKKTAELASLGENEIVDLWKLVVHAQSLLRFATR